MPRIILSDEQLRLYRETRGQIEICDSAGNVLGKLDPSSDPAFLAELKRRVREETKGYTGDQVRNHLRILEDAWKREGPFDEKRMREVLREARQNDRA
jgi:hypothetical protein